MKMIPSHWLDENWWIIAMIGLGFIVILGSLFISPGGYIYPGLP